MLKLVGPEKIKGGLWRKVWQLPVKPKLKHFLWRSIHNWLATGSAVRVRGTEIDDTCRRCGLEEETRKHIFFHCQESQLVWKLAPVSWEGILRTTEHFEDWWMSLCLAKQDSKF